MQKRNHAGLQFTMLCWLKLFIRHINVTWCSELNILFKKNTRSIYTKN